MAPNMVPYFVCWPRMSLMLCPRGMSHDRHPLDEIESDPQRPTRAAIYHLAIALVRSGVLDPEELVQAASRLEREGRESDEPDLEDWSQLAHLMRLAALDIEGEGRPQLGVVDGGKE